MIFIFITTVLAQFFLFYFSIKCKQNLSIKNMMYHYCKETKNLPAIVFFPIVYFLFFLVLFSTSTEKWQKE